MKKILSLLVFALTSVASFAQWTEPQAPEFAAPATDGETVQYLYNVELKSFFCGGNAWSTQASVDTKGWAIKTKLLEDGTYEMVDSVQNGNFKGSWRNIWASAYNSVYTDYNNNKDADIKWKFTMLGDNKLQIENNTAFNVDEEDQKHSGLLGVSEKVWQKNDDETGEPVYQAGGTVVYLIHASQVVDLSSENYSLFFNGAAYTTWAFVNAEVYDAYIGYAARYAAAMDLKNAIDNAEAECADPLIDLADEKAVYNNTESTLEQLQAAIASVKAKVEKWKNDNELGKATLENPIDITSRMMNPNFDDTKGWNGSPAKGGDASNYCAEKYNCSFDVNQVVRNLPVGIYRISAQGFYRHGNTDNASQGYTDGIEDTYEAYFYGNSVNAHIPSIFRDNKLCDESWGGAYVDSKPDNGRVPNNMTAASFIFANDLYKTDFLVYVYGTDTLKLGAKKAPADNPGANWSIFDNFKLECVGNGTESWNAFKEQYKKNITVFPATTVAHKQLLADYNKAIADFNAATDPAAIVALIEPIQVLSDSINKSIAAYKTLQAKVNEILDLIDQLSGQSETSLAWVEYMQNTSAEKAAEITTKLNNLIAANFKGEYVFDTAYTPLVQLNPTAAAGCTLTAPEAIAYADMLNKAHVTITLAIKKPGDDCTEMIVNASFKDGFTGWNKTGCTGNVNVGGLESLPSVEVWNGKVEVYQEVPGVPNGLYELNCNAFERPTSGAYSGDGTDPSKVFLYMNDFKTGVMNIATDALLKDDAEPGVNCAPNAEWPEGDKVIRGGEADASWTDLEGHEYWIPNGMAGASLAFKAGRYEQKVYGLVEDGKMKIGLTSNNVTCGWVLWTNFKLTFWGTDPTVALTVLKEATAEAQAWQTIYADDLYDEAFEELDNAITAGTDATADMTGEQLLAILKDLYKALDNAEAALALVNELKEVADQLGTTYEAFAETASPEAAAKAEELIAQAEDYLGLTGEQIKQLIADMKDCIEDLKMFDVSEATDEEPMDVTASIVNPDFETGNSNGWTIDKKTTQNSQKLGTSWGGTSWEFWAGSATNLAFDIQQTIKLAEATYTLSANMVNSYNGEEPAKDAEGNENSGRIYLYVGIICDGDTTLINDQPVVPTTENCGDHFDTYYVTFKVPAPAAKVIVGARTVGTLSARWAAIDDFKLECYGTQSSKETSDGHEVIIEGVDAAPTTVAPTAIFTISGARSNTFVKGINIVRMADGSVKKIIK